MAIDAVAVEVTGIGANNIVMTWRDNETVVFTTKRINSDKAQHDRDRYGRFEITGFAA